MLQVGRITQLNKCYYTVFIKLSTVINGCKLSEENNIFFYSQFILIDSIDNVPQKLFKL